MKSQNYILPTKLTSKLSHKYIDTLIQWPLRSSSIGAHAFIQSIIWTCWECESGMLSLWSLLYLNMTYGMLYIQSIFWCYLGCELNRYLDFVSAVEVQFTVIIEDDKKRLSTGVSFPDFCWSMLRLFSDTTEVCVNIVLNMQSVTLCNLRNRLLNPQSYTVNKQSPAVSLFSLLSVMWG